MNVRSQAVSGVFGRVVCLSLALALAACGRSGETPTEPVVASVIPEKHPLDPSGGSPGAARDGAHADHTAAVNADPAEGTEPVQKKPVIVTIVIGTFPPELREAVETGLRESLPVEVRAGPTWDLPKSAYYPPRRRYRADTLIDLLSEAAQKDTQSDVRYLGLTSVDISTTKDGHRDWGIFGLAFSPGSGAVISNYRLKKSAKSPEHFAFRVTNTAIHEVGHSLGLAHCDEAKCPMRDAKGSVASTDDSSQVLGPECAAELATELAEDR